MKARLHNALHRVGLNMHINLGREMKGRGDGTVPMQRDEPPALVQCPSCPFMGTQSDVDDHFRYMEVHNLHDPEWDGE